MSPVPSPTPTSPPAERERQREHSKNDESGHIFSYTHRIVGVPPGTNACILCGKVSADVPERPLSSGAIALGVRP